MAETIPGTPDPDEENIRRIMEPASSEPAAAQPAHDGEAGSGIPTSLDDPETDKAVEAISKKDGDEALAAQDKAAASAYVMKPTLRERFANAWSAWWGSPKKRYGTIAAAIVLVGVLAALPVTRYGILGLFIKKPVWVAVVDSKTGAPISGAVVQVGTRQAKTEASGKATLAAKLGTVTIRVTKKYYQAASQNVTVTFSQPRNNFKVPLRALGRQVPIKVVNKITGKPLAGAVLNVQGSETKTDNNGLATIVLASSATNQKAEVSLDGYNSASVTIEAADGVTAANTFSLTPAGELYFLSNQSGKIDVVKTNLDGTNRQTVLAGTGNEDPGNTTLLATRDWSYLALLAKRDTSTYPSLYLIDTANGDKLSVIDQGNAYFNPVGWSGDTFVYSMTRPDVPNWQPNAEALKSYDAATGKTTLLDQTVAEGSSSTDYGYTNFSAIYILDNDLVYARNWYGSTFPNHLNGKSVSLVSIRPDGTGHKTIKDFPVPAASSYYSVSLYPDGPSGVYVQVPNGTTNTYYSYQNGTLSPAPNVTDSTFNVPSPTYLLSPSGNATFWAEQRDGKNALFVGDKNAGNPKQIAASSSYVPYGWYSDAYLLVSKNSNELYILPADGGSTTPQKVSAYFKPPISYNAYGGSYGGL